MFRGLLAGYGLAAGTAAVAESVLGEGGLSTSLKKSMVEKYVENEQDIAQYADLKIL